MNLKEFFEYIFNQFKFWVIVNEWECGIILRRGKLRRKVNSGIYFKIPILDSLYCQPNRTKELDISQTNALTKDRKTYTISIAVHYKIEDVWEFYTGYAEPNEIIAQTVKREMVMHISETRSEDIKIKNIEDYIMDKLEDGKGFAFETIKVITITNAKTLRLILDKSYSLRMGELIKGLTS